MSISSTLDSLLSIYSNIYDNTSSPFYLALPLHLHTMPFLGVGAKMRSSKSIKMVF